MANRVMEAKRYKMSRARKQMARVLQRKGIQIPNRDVIQEYKEHALGLKDHAFVDTPPPKIEPKLEKQAELEIWLPKGCTLRVLGPSGRDQLQESWIYFNAQRNCFVLIHVDREQRIERRSLTFSSKDMLLFAWETGTIRWAYKATMILLE